MSKQRYLLSIDGGGIKGVIPLCALIKLEKETGLLTKDIFSFIAGTSTGAIIAGGLSLGIPAARLLNLYMQQSQKLISKSVFNFPRRLFKGYMYSTQKLHEMILQELGSQKNISVNQLPHDILITAKRICDSHPFYFVRDNEKNSHKYGCLKLADVITASAAATTFFHPWNIPIPGSLEKTGELTDGSIGVAGNPVYIACVEAFFYNSYKPETTTIVSLGTSRFIEVKKPQWLPEWFSWIVHELLSSPAEQQTEIVQRHFPECCFYRLDPDLKKLDPSLKKDIEIDDVHKIELLKKYGEMFAEMINWQNILKNQDSIFKVTEKNTQRYQYQQP